jgi:hypothetical protein
MFGEVRSASLCNVASVLHDTVYDYVHLLCDRGGGICGWCVLCRSDDGSFYVVTWELIVKLLLWVWGCRGIAFFILILGCG